MLRALLSGTSRALRRAANAVDVVRGYLGDEGALHGDDPSADDLPEAHLTQAAEELLAPPPNVAPIPQDEVLEGSLAARAARRG